MVQNSTISLVSALQWWRGRGLCLLLLVAVWSSALFAQDRRDMIFDLGGMVYPDALQWIEKDTAGFIWLATDHGLLRTDGYRHRWILQGESSRITSLFVGREAVYVGHEDGSLASVDIVSQQVKQRTPAVGSAINCIHEWTPDRIIFGTRDKGLAWWNGSNVEFMSQLDSTLDQTVHCLARWNNRLMVATDLGLYSVDFAAGPTAYRLDEQRVQLSDHYINAMQETTQGLFLAGENGSLCVLRSDGSVQQATYFNAFHSDPIAHLALHDDAVWVIDRSHHLYSLQLDQLDRIFASSQYADSDAWSEVKDVCVNQHGTMMSTTGLSEIIMMDLIQHSITRHDSIDLTALDALAITADRLIWMANSSGLYSHHADFIEGQEMKQVVELHGEHIVAIGELDATTLVAGTFGDGLLVLNRKTGAVFRMNERNGLINNHVTSMAIQGNRIWLATLGGLSCLESTTWKEIARYDANSPLGAGYLYGVHPMADGSLLIGTDGKGLISMAGGEFTALREQHPEMAKSIVQMAIDETQRLWLVTLDQGIQCWAGKNLQAHPKLSAAQLGEIGSIQIYKGQQLLVFSSKGLFRYDPSTGLLQVVKEMRNALADGFQNMLIDPLTNRLWLVRKGDLWSCDLDEFVHLHVPRVFVDGVLQSLQPVPMGTRSFDPDENYLTFLLSIPWFDQSEFPSVRYRLLGLDSNWITTQERMIHWPKLAPGSYELELQVMLHGEVMPGPTTRFEFVIRRPFYQSIWFIVICLVGIAVAVVFFLRMRDRRMARRAIVRQKQLEGELQLLRSQINPHFLFNSFNTLIYTIEKNQEEAVEYVEQLSDYFRLVLQRTNEPLITVGEELVLVKHYVYLQKKRFGTLLEIMVDIPDSMRDHLIPPMVIQMLLENAVKHNTISRDHALRVTVFGAEDSIVVSNNVNAMIKHPSGTGTGLRNIQRRIAILTDREVVLRHDSDCFEVRVPLIKKMNTLV